MQWVDYSNKFGFGYQLSNNAIGLLFNDSTKLGCSGDRWVGISILSDARISLSLTPSVPSLYHLLYGLSRRQLGL